MENSGLVSTFVKKHLQIEKELENKIADLEDELRKYKSMPNDDKYDNDYALYKDILDIIIPKIRFEYNSDSPEAPYSMSVDPTPLPNNCINELVKEVKKYQENNSLSNVQFIDNYYYVSSDGCLTYKIYEDKMFWDKYDKLK